MSFTDQPQYVMIKCKEEAQNIDNSNNGMSFDQEHVATEEEDEVAGDNEMEFGATEVMPQVINSVLIPSNEEIEPETRSWCEWTSEATKTLIEIYKAYRDGVGSAKLRNMKKFWEFISKKLREKGYTYTAANCENKFRVLERNYRKYVGTDGKKGRFKRYFEYYEETKEIFGTKWSPYTNPISSKHYSKANSSTIRLDSTPTQHSNPPQIMHTSSIPIFTTTSLAQASTSHNTQHITPARVLIALPTTQVLKHPSPAIIHPPKPPTPPVEPMGPPSSPDSSCDEKDPLKAQKATFVRVLQKIRKDNSRYKKEKAAYLRSKARYYEEKNRKMNDIIGEMRNLTQSVVRLCNSLGR